MAGEKTAWGIEIGSQAIKALLLERQGKEVRILDYSYIPYKKVLSTPDLDADEMTRLAIGQFMSQRPDIADGAVLVSVPGNAAFARFAKLPPVEPKKVPDIVKFEAVQQIPFPIEEVEWDYEAFMSDDSPEVEVGIFAITKANILARLGLYSELGLHPDGLTISPVAAYNAMRFDLGLDESSGGVIVLDIGTTSTDLIISEEGRTWIRTFPIGGHTFTEALIDAFKLTYSKAEKLKGEAQTSKYRRQILSALRPVFSDLVQDVQRSIGYYQSIHSETNLTKLIGVGSTFRLPGLRKFLSQQLQMEVVRLDDFEKIKMTGRGAEQFVNHTVNYATAYGLALQGLGLAPIDVNLIPVPVIRERLWGQKIKWFGAAAALVVFGSLLCFARPFLDGKYKEQHLHGSDIRETIQIANEYQQRFDEINDATPVDGRAHNIVAMLDHRDVWSYIIADVSQILTSGDPQSELSSGDPEVLASIPPAERRVMELKNLAYTYIPPSENSDEVGESSVFPRMKIRLTLETPMKNAGAFVNQTAFAWIRQNTDRPGIPYRIVSEPVFLSRLMKEVPGGDEGEGSGRDNDSSPSRRSPSGGG